jgi:hypothetical protein
MTKDDFLLAKSDSSSSSNSDQHKKLSKKQAKKVAKENRKNQLTTDDNDKLVNKISKITLQANPDEQSFDSIYESGKILSEEKEDKLPDMPQVVPRASMYRRHMSESQAYVEPASNGEFKLKVSFQNLRNLNKIFIFRAF